MPSSFRIRMRHEDQGYPNYFTNYSCREVWLYEQAAPYYFCGRDMTEKTFVQFVTSNWNFTPYIEELKARWYPNLEYAVEDTTEIDYFTGRLINQHVLTLSDVSLLAVGAAWWLILLQRLALYDHDGADAATSIDALIDNSDCYNDMVWDNSNDLVHHRKLLRVFDEIRDPVQWFKYCEAKQREKNFYMRGPIYYLGFVNSGWEKRISLENE